MLFETLQRVLGKEADLVQFQPFVFVHRVLFRVDVQRFLDSPLHAVTFAIYDLHVVKIKSMRLKNDMLGQQQTHQIVHFWRRIVPRHRFAVYTRMVEDTCWPPWSIPRTGGAKTILVVRPIPFLQCTIAHSRHTWSWDDIQYLRHHLDWSDLSAAAGATTSSFLAFQHWEASGFSAGAGLLHQQMVRALLSVAVGPREIAQTTPSSVV